MSSCGDEGRGRDWWSVFIIFENDADIYPHSDSDVHSSNSLRRLNVVKCFHCNKNTKTGHSGADETLKLINPHSLFIYIYKYKRGSRIMSRWVQEDFSSFVLQLPAVSLLIIRTSFQGCFILHIRCTRGVKLLSGRWLFKQLQETHTNACLQESEQVKLRSPQLGKLTSVGLNIHNV